MGLVLVEEDEAKLQHLTSAITSSKTSVKSTYASYVTYSDGGEES